MCMGVEHVTWVTVTTGSMPVFGMRDPSVQICPHAVVFVTRAISVYSLGQCRHRQHTIAAVPRLTQP